ncbi:hypothetical protein GCM10027591_15040 [Zhihengliuella somnathii]
MLVLTIDQRDSRRNPDLVAGLLERLNRDHTPLRAFERTAGDEVQAVLEDATEALAIALRVVATGDWSVGLGIGRVEEPLPAQTRAGRGEAFELARDAVERAKSSSGRIAVSGKNPGVERLEAELQMIASVDLRRTATSQEAGELVASGLTQRDVAERLGISQQAVSSRLASGLWYETQRLLDHARAAADELNALVAARGSGRAEPS